MDVVKDCNSLLMSLALLKSYRESELIVLLSRLCCFGSHSLLILDFFVCFFCFCTHVAFLTLAVCRMIKWCDFKDAEKGVLSTKS